LLRLEFTERLRAETSGEAFPQCVFNYWEAVNSDPLEEGSTAAKLHGDISIQKEEGSQGHDAPVGVR
jgi:elongation factor 2